ncbi:MAG: hypothetical protein HONBIEJF_02299 [Fimbriimonadaceae bacterium]|nr:hypothetical protein [Fimbriimonadaceae bacterium]
MLAATLSFILAQEFNLTLRREFVDEIDRIVQERFMDLSATQKGEFGISRIESNMIEAHFKRTSPPIKKHGLGAGIAIYGAKGKALDVGPLECRFLRWSAWAGGPNSGKLRKLTLDLKEIAATVPEFSRDRKLDRKEFARKPYYAQIRPIRLSKKECLPCHKGMSIDEPVALAVYTILPTGERTKPPRGKMATDATPRAGRMASRR